MAPNSNEEQSILPPLSRNGASWTAQCQEIPHLLPEPFYQVMQVWVGEPTTHPPLTFRFSQKLVKCNKSLKDPACGEKF